MNFKPYLENILKDEEFTKWEKLYIPLKAEDVIEELPRISVIEEIVLKNVTIEDREALQEQLKRKKYEFKNQEVIRELTEGKNRRVILVGESGSGKTTLLKWLTLSYAKQNINTLSPTGDVINQQVALYVDLGTYHKKIEMEGFLAEILRNRGLECPFEELIASFEVGKFLFLFDGLDLLGPKVNDFDPVISIQKFINKYPKNTYILSCRKGICYASFPTNYKIVEILELTNEKIEEYIAQYVKDSDRKKEILNQIWQVPQFKEIVCRTPLILLLIIAIFNRYKQIPYNKTQAYSYYTRCLYDLFEKIGKIEEIEKTLINDILCQLGFELQLNDQTVIRKEQVLEIIAHFIIKHKYEKMAKDEILRLCSQLGFLKIQDEDVKFSYQSFREYFASLKLKELFLKGVDISPIFTHPKWEEVLIFLTSNLEPEDASKLIRSIITTPYEFRNPLFVAAKCIIGNQIEENTRQEVIDQLLNKISDKYWYNQREAIYALTQILGEKIESKIVEPLIQKLKDEEWIRREKSAKAMGKICDKGAIPHLKRLLEDESPAVYNAAFEAIVEIERREKEDIKVEFKEIKEEDFQPFEVSEKTEIVHEKVEEKEIPSPEAITVVYIKINRAVEGVGIQLEEAKSVIINQIFTTILKPIIEAEEGNLEYSEGGIEEVSIATFNNPKNALYCTIKMQSGVDEYNMRQPSRKVSLKLAVYTAKHGESINRMKNISAKICELARAGQILLVENTYKAIYGKDNTLKFRYFGSRRLEGEESQKRGIYELLWQGEEHASMIKESTMAIEYLEQVSAINITKNKSIISKIKVSRNFLARLKGLMFIKEPQALVIEFPELSGTKTPIHTFFVKFPIDAIFLDPNFKVVDITENLQPFRLYTPRAPAKYVLQVPSGTVKTSGIELSDIIIFKE